MMKSAAARWHAAAMIGAGLAAVMAGGAALPASAQQAAPGQPAPAPVSAAADTPATTPMTDLLTRMDGLETQMARLTAQNEELANHQRQIDARLAAAAATPPAAATSAPGSTPATAAPLAAAPPSANASNLAAMAGGESGAGATEPSGPARASAQRVAAVKAVIKPQTGDAAGDDYAYGFRLYTAKLYAEAAQQLKLYIDKDPHDAHISFARNLLGRAYLDDGKPRDAAPWFLTNYKTDPHGLRAADSLLNLAAAMRQLGDDTRACVALNEFAATYADAAQGRLRPDYARMRGHLTCN